MVQGRVVSGQTVDIQVAPVYTFALVPNPGKGATLEECATFTEIMGKLSADGYNPMAWGEAHVILGKIVGLYKVTGELSSLVLPVVAGPLAGSRS